MEALKELVTALTEQVAALATGKQTSRQLSGLMCFHCNQPGHEQHNGPNKFRQCYVCERVGHIASKCQSGNKNGAPRMGWRHHSKPFVFAMLVAAVVRSQDPTVKGQLGNTCVEVMLDSGSSISLIKESLINGYCVNQDPPEGLNLVSAAGEPIPAIGKLWHQYKLAIFMLITVLLLFVP